MKFSILAIFCLTVGIIAGTLVVSVIESICYDVSMYDALFIESWNTK